METATLGTGRELRWLADSYEQAQRIRIETGERIRAVLQNRDETWGAGEFPEMDRKEVDVILLDIGGGESTGPVPILGRTYHRHLLEENELRKEMGIALKHHPAWPWLLQVRGIGPTLGGKILAKLDIEKAEHASSFCAYAGLATVPGNRWKCPTCGLVRGWPVSFKVTGTHTKLHGTSNCKDKLVLIAGPEDGVRVAQPKPSRGEKATYDMGMKKTMFLVGSAFLKAGGPYERHYRTHRARLEVERPGWSDGRKHYTALRIAEKLFLCHLWQVWREALGMPTATPYPVAVLGHDESSIIGPWEMTGK